MHQEKGPAVRGSPASMSVLRPRGAKEALAAYAKNPTALPLAGGTDVMVLWNMGLLNGRTILDLSGVTEWAKIKKTSRGLALGALVTHRDLQKHAAVAARLPLLVQACATVGAAQIQSRGTLGGNIANASPAGDTFPVLAVYEPVVQVVGPSGARSIPFSGIFSGVKKTTLGPSELIASVDVPFLKKKPSRQLFRKVGTRLAQAISKTMAAGLLWLKPDGRVEELRFALGSMAPTVRRLTAAEAYLKGRKLTAETVEQACLLLEDDVAPIDDIRSTREYRLQVSKNLLRSFLS